MKNVASGDVKQGSLGDCWMIAGLTALASVEDGIRRLCVAHDTSMSDNGIFLQG